MPWKKIAVHAMAAFVAVTVFWPGNTVYAQRTWHVSMSGDDVRGDGSYAKPWRTIQYAIERAGRGDTVVVGNGVYDEQITISKTIILTSSTGDYATSNVVLTGGGSGWALITVESAASGSVIQGFRFDKVVSGDAVIFGSTGAHNVTIRSNSFTDCNGSAVFLYDTGDREGYKGWLIVDNRIDGVLGTGKAGMWLGTLVESKIVGNTIERTNGPAIVLQHAEDVVISNNRLSNFLAAGILIPETASPRWVSKLSIKDNLINGTLAPSRGQIEAPYGIRIASYVTDVQIAGNCLTGNASGLVVSGSEPVALSVEVAFNSIYANVNYGVENLSGGELAAVNNWWGANDGPGGAGKGSGDKVSAGVRYEPWLKLEVAAEPKSVVIGGSATLNVTADLTRNSQGESTVELGHLFDGTEVVFTAERGMFENKDTRLVKTTKGGKVVARLTSGNQAGGVAVCAEAPHHSAVPSEQCRQCIQVNFVTGAAQSVSAASGSGNVVLSSSIGNIVRLVAFSEKEVGCSGKPANVSFLHGLFSFGVVDIAPGSTAIVTIALPMPTPRGTQFWQCNPGSGWQQLPVGSDDGDSVFTITVTDGGVGDSDGAPDGTISVSGGPGVSGGVPVHLGVEGLEVEPKQVYTGQSVNVRVKLVNRGSAPDAYTVVAKIDGQEEHRQVVRVEGKTSLWYEFVIAKAQPGTYTVTVDSKQATFRVMASGERLPEPLSVWAITAICTVVAVLATGAVAWWLIRYRSRKAAKA